MKRLAVVIATALAVSLHAQTDWRLLDRTDAPRSSHAMAFDLVTSKTILFGGLDGPQPMAATRLWDGQQWTDPSPAIEPPARAAHCMACDITRGRVVLFGGLGTGGVRLADTWEWNGANWSHRLPAHQPPPRAAAAMAHDLLHGRTLLFGGELANGVLDGELWEWDGVDWTQRLAPIAPPGICRAPVCPPSPRSRRRILSSRLHPSGLDLPGQRSRTAPAKDPTYARDLPRARQLTSRRRARARRDALRACVW